MCVGSPTAGTSSSSQSRPDNEFETDRCQSFRRSFEHRGIVGPDPIGVLAHLQLGRTFALAGDKVKAKRTYEDFLTLWKDADSDVPILVQAKAEYTRLRSRQFPHIRFACAFHQPTQRSGSTAPPRLHARSNEISGPG